MQTSFFDSQFFSGNRSRLRKLFTGTAPIVITAQGLLQRNAGMAYPFRQDSNFWYLTGLNIPGAVLVLEADKEYLIIPDLSPNDEVFGRPHDFEAIQKRSGVTAVLTERAGWKKLASRVKRAKHVATLSPAPAYHEHYAFFTNPARARLVDQLKQINPSLELLDLREHFGRLRVVKQPGEIAAIKHAVQITERGIKDVLGKLPSYANEYEIEADLTRSFRKAGALGHSFTPIVAAGKNTCHLHHETNDGPIKSGDILYLDVGAEVEYYAADITRTVTVGEPTKRQRAVIQAVEDVAAFARGRLRPGVVIRENEQAIETFMGEKLRELGLIKSITRESVRRYYPHSASHYLGLDVHDVGDYDRPLEPDMVLTVEPGIYIQEEGIGVRIEDDVLVTASGIEVLSEGVPRLPW